MNKQNINVYLHRYQIIKITAKKNGMSTTEINTIVGFTEVLMNQDTVYC